MKAQFLPLFNVNLSQPQLKSTSTQFQLKFYSTSSQPLPQPSLNSTLTSTQPQLNLNFNLNLNLNSNSTLISTQYGCDIKATQSCAGIIYYRKFCPIAGNSEQYTFQQIEVRLQIVNRYVTIAHEKPLHMKKRMIYTHFFSSFILKVFEFITGNFLDEVLSNT